MNIRVKIFTISLFILVATAHNASSQEAIPCKDEKGKWGLVDSNGNYITKAKYSDIIESKNGSFLVAIGGKIKDGLLEDEKWGVIDASGNQLLKAEYDEIGDFINGLARLTKDNKQGFVNEQWEIVIPTDYNFTGLPNKQGFVWVNSGGKPDKAKYNYLQGGKFGIFDKTGKIIVPVKYASIGLYTELKARYGDLELYSTSTPLERLMLECGSHSLFMPIAIEQRQDYMLPDVMGFAFSSKAGLRRNGVIDLNGNIIINNDCYEKCTYPVDGISIVTAKNTSSPNVVYYIDTKKAKPGFRIKNFLSSFKNGFAIGMDSSKKWRFYNKSLDPVGEPYDWISPYISNFYITKRGESMTLLKASDLSAVVENKEMIFPPSNGYLTFKDAETKKWGFLNIDGSVALEPKYDNAYSFNHGCAFVCLPSGWGAIDTSLKERITPQYCSLKFPINDDFKYIWAKTSKNEKRPYICLNWKSGQQAFPQSFSNAYNFTEIGNTEASLVEIENKYGVINNNGEIIIPLEMNSNKEAQFALDYYLKIGIKSWEAIHTYRFGVYNDNSRNSYRLKDKIKESHWDY